MQEDSIIDMVMKGAPWEDVLETIVYEEGMDPWDIDITRLGDAFLQRLEGWKEFNFRIPARFIIIAAILLSLKTAYLREKEEVEKLVVEKGKLEIDITQIPDLEAPSMRVPKKKVSLEELVAALEKAFETSQRRDDRKSRARRRVEELLESPVDIEEAIKDLYGRISNVLERMKDGTLEFSSLVPAWERDNIIKTFVPLLHLSQEGKIICEQKEMFKEIYIKLKGGV